MFVKAGKHDIIRTLQLLFDICVKHADCNEFECRFDCGEPEYCQLIADYQISIMKYYNDYDHNSTDNNGNACCCALCYSSFRCQPADFFDRTISFSRDHSSTGLIAHGYLFTLVKILVYLAGHYKTVFSTPMLHAAVYCQLPPIVKQLYQMLVTAFDLDFKNGETVPNNFVFRLFAIGSNWLTTVCLVKKQLQMSGQLL